MNQTHTPGNQNQTGYQRRVANAERLFSRSPFSVVGLVARLVGQVSVADVRDAVVKARQRHPLLGARIIHDEQGEPWFTTDGAGDIPVETVARESDDQWIQVLTKGRQVPFDFGVRPPVRVVLVQSPALTEMIILCHHIICDGLSLAYLVRDLLTTIADPSQEPGDRVTPVPVDANSLPSAHTPSKLAAYFIGRINEKWQSERVLFDQQDYLDLCQTYWQHYDHRCLSIEITEAQTDELVARCRREHVTVNSALAAAFAGGQALALGQAAYNPKLAVAVNLRTRLNTEIGEALGFYAGAPMLGCRYKARQGFWDNARRFHKAIGSRLGDKHVLQDFVNWSQLDPTILEAVNYKKLGHLTTPAMASHDKLAAFAKREDTVSRILERDGQLALDGLSVGTAITNLTRLDFARTYGPLELDRLMMVPGGAFPLAKCGLVLGAVTCAGKLSLTIEFAEQAVSTEDMVRVRDKAMGMLLGAG